MQTHRPVVMSSRGLVASGHPLASQAGLRVLREGGNAFDAAIAAAGVVAVCKPSMNSIGGDNMALIWDAQKQELFALNGNGYAPASATPAAYKNGIPHDGPLAASIPGAVAGWEAILSRFGTRTLASLLEDAIFYAEHGFPVSQLLHRDLKGSQALLARRPDTARVFTPGGAIPDAGTPLVQPDLAGSLKLIARDGARAFYQGEIAQRIEAYMAKHGGLITARDLAGFQPQWKPPIRTSYRGVDFYGQPAPSQGFIIGEELNILESCESRMQMSADLVHTMVEAKKLSFADRLRYLGDPDFGEVPLDALLSKEHGRRRAAQIAGRAAPEYPAGALGGGETTYLCVADEQGNAISFIQSIFENFGSGVVVDGTGILLNDRMLGFNTEPGHVNCVAPHKRPAMTLNTCMLFRDDRPWVVFGTPGADAQVQTNFQHAVDFVDFGMDVQQAIESPRWMHVAGTGLLLESRWPEDIVSGLRERGHDPHVTTDWDSRMGGAQAIMIDPRTGTLQGGADPRREGYAIGY